MLPLLLLLLGLSVWPALVSESAFRVAVEAIAELLP